MAKASTRFVCQNCGHEELRWLGRCPGCQEWNSFMEVKPAPIASGAGKGAHGYTARRSAGSAGSVGSGGSGSEVGSGFGGTGFSGSTGQIIPRGPDASDPIPLSAVSSAEGNRLPVEPEEVARVLGGGLVEGSVVLLGGEPGVGKSTLLTGLALWWTRRGIRVIYVAGEESASQIRMRAQRLGFRPDDEEGFAIVSEVQLEVLLETLYEDRRRHADCKCIIIADSIQTLHSGQIDAWPGSPSQIRFCGGVLSDFARQSACPVFLVGHVTKSGDLAGPKLLEHMVDTVLYFEGSGGGPIRMVRAVKNRFGTTGELAIMEMQRGGLVPVDEAGIHFLSGRRGIEPGSAVCAVKNGARVFLVEVQALVSPARYGTPQRVVQGVDSKRVALLAAILEKRAGLDLAGCDIFVKVTGGTRIDDPAADLAIITALASSLREIPIPADTIVLGEVGLTGEVREVTDRAGRLREAKRHGFKRAVSASVEKSGGADGNAATRNVASRSATSRNAGPTVHREGGLEIAAVSTVDQAVAESLGR